MKQHGAPRETQSNDPSISNQTLYHCLTLQVTTDFKGVISVSLFVGLVQ